MRQENKSSEFLPSIVIYTLCHSGLPSSCCNYPSSALPVSVSLQHPCLTGSIPCIYSGFFFFISQLMNSLFKNLAGLQVLFWDLPTSHLQKQRRMMRNMALGASSWKSSSLRQGQNLSKMIQPIPSMKEMRRMKMKCINKYHFHMLLSCSEFWEITKKRRGKTHSS